MVIQERENGKDFLERTVFIVLFFLFIWSFSDRDDHPAGQVHQYSSVYELPIIIAINDFQKIPRLEELLPVTDNLACKFFTENIRILTDNRCTHLRISYLQKAEQTIKPLILERFYNPCHYVDIGDIPILS